jgi:acetyl esterase/lipase
MAFSIDPEIEAILKQAMAAGGAQPPPTVRGDALALRQLLDAQMVVLDGAWEKSPEVTKVTHRTTAGDGTEIELHWYSKAGAATGSAVLYIHGGGMVCGSVPLYDGVITDYVARTGVPMLAPSYRLAPEYPQPIPVEDAYAGLAWLADNAARLRVDPARIAVMGDSAGGGIAAGVALLARDRGLPLKRQILIYPMLDDRNVEPDDNLVPFAAWTYDQNFTGWSALLGPKLGTNEVPPIAAPARATDLHGLAPAYVEVGELDLFRDEDIEYARRLTAAGVSTELHVHPGAAHGFERMAPGSDVAKRAMADRVRVITAI